MTPQERQLVDELFARLAALEQSPREPDATAAINEGLRRAPNAIYALVQTVLLQDEALKQAHARLQQYEAPPQQERGFLDSMRDSLFGGGEQRRGSVPSVGGNVWNTQQPQYQNQPNNQPNTQPMAQQAGGFGGGGSFLGTAAAAAAGVIGGSLLMNSLRGAMGGGDKQAFGSTDSTGDSKPWGDASKSDLARDAGAGDVGKGGDRQGLFDTASNDHDHGGGDDFDGDMGSGDSDFG
jgi:hypothetical protein